MTALSKEVIEAWEEHVGPTALATVGADGGPNVVYATCVRLLDETRFIIADNFFSKTRDNVLNGSKGALLFITKEDKAYQIKGNFEYHRDGEPFDHMKTWNPSHLPGNAAVVMHIEEVFSGAEKLG